jgi:hypothetical protein
MMFFQFPFLFSDRDVIAMNDSVSMMSNKIIRAIAHCALVAGCNYRTLVRVDFDGLSDTINLGDYESI